MLLESGYTVQESVAAHRRIYSQLSLDLKLFHDLGPSFITSSLESDPITKCCLAELAHSQHLSVRLLFRTGMNVPYKGAREQVWMEMGVIGSYIRKALISGMNL